MERIRIFDTTLRDGEQSPGASMTPAEKVRLAHQLDALGVDIIEAGFPASSPSDLASVREIARVVRRPVIAALARCAASDIEQAALAIEYADRARIHVFIATSPIHLRHKLRITEEECIERAARAVEHARRYTDDVQFSAEDATRSDPAFLCRITSAVITAGATTINMPDTVGYTHPVELQRLLTTLRAGAHGVDDVVLSVHCHDDLGLAVANSLAGIEAGARQVECTVNGIGERAGNAALEEIVMALRTRCDHYGYETAVAAQEIARTSQLLTFITGVQPQPNKAIVGRNAFAHEAGIHQDGMLKERSTYEIMTPESVGVRESSLVLGKHSGRNALSQRYRALGYELDTDEVERTWRMFKMLADSKKEILDEDLIAILHYNSVDGVPQRYRLRALHVVCGEGQAAARVRITDGERPLEAAADGDGPIAAAFTAINALVPYRMELDELTIHAITPSSDAIGETTLRVRANGQTFSGRGASPDVVNAAVRAYLHALNKAAHAEVLESVALEKASQLWGV